MQNLCIMKRRIGFASLLFLALLLGGEGMACAHQGHGDSHNVTEPAAEFSLGSSQPESTESVGQNPSRARISGFGTSGELPDSCICCGSSHDGATASSAPTFMKQKKRGTLVAAAPDMAGAAAVATQGKSRIPAREHGPPSASVKRHLLIGIFLI